MHIIICGAPGSGKGTQSDLLIEKYGFRHISTGELLREEISKDTSLGQYSNMFISDGQLVPDEVIIDIIARKLDELNDNAAGIVLDGFPRTTGQAEALEKLFAERSKSTDVLLDLVVEEEELVSRLLNRGKTSGRNDDNLETIKKRLKVYHEQTEPVIEYYKKLGKYAGINGMGTVQEIFSRIEKEIDDIIMKRHSGKL